MEEANFQTEPAMSVTEYVSSFNGFSDVYPSYKIPKHELARLFDKCEFDKEGTHRHDISFKKATKRLRTAADNSLSAVEIITKRKVSEFRIGKTSVVLKVGQTFDPMKPTTWGKVGGANVKWQKHKDDNYDGLLAVGCVTNELIPKVVRETNTDMNHQMYALGMTQALVHHYMVQEPDGRLRNKSFDIGNCSEGKKGDEGGIIYVAYKLEPEIILKVDGLAIKKEKQEREEKERIDMERKINEERKYKETIEKSEKDRDIETEERERMRVDISSSGAMGKEESDMLYRLLRPDESYEDGLRAKNPNSSRSVFDHVISGSRGQKSKYISTCGSRGQESKYISTCGSWEAVNSFRSNSVNPGSIVKIQKNRLPSINFEIIDLRRQETKNLYIHDAMGTGSFEQFNNVANRFQEVLLVGHVPGECIELCDD